MGSEMFYRYQQSLIEDAQAMLADFFAVGRRQSALSASPG